MEFEHFDAVIGSVDGKTTPTGPARQKFRIEPAYMGKSLNLSPLMIILSLTFWGMLWGMPGIFLSVPIMVAATIICSRFENLRWIAVVLSADGGQKL